jgi:hypothetical protein
MSSHAAILVPSIRKASEYLSQFNFQIGQEEKWYAQTAYLARPGFPPLIEVHERTELIERPLFVDRISIPIDSSLLGLVKTIGLDGLVKP